MSNMAPDDFYDWRMLKGWTQIQAATALGISRRSVQLYEEGSQPIPRPIELACMCLALGRDRYERVVPWRSTLRDGT